MSDTPEIAAIRARWQAATPGPWVAETDNEHPEDPDCGVMVVLPSGHWGWVCDLASVQGAGVQRDDDAIAIAAAPADIATLLAALDEAQARESALRTALAEVAAHNPYPADIWTRLEADDEDALMRALDSQGVAFGRDRLFAHWARAVLANVQALIQQGEEMD